MQGNPGGSVKYHTPPGSTSHEVCFLCFTDFDVKLKKRTISLRKQWQ